MDRRQLPMLWSAHKIAAVKTLNVILLLLSIPFTIHFCCILNLSSPPPYTTGDYAAGSRYTLGFNRFPVAVGQCLAVSALMQLSLGVGSQHFSCRLSGLGVASKLVGVFSSWLLMTVQADTVAALVATTAIMVTMVATTTGHNDRSCGFCFPNGCRGYVGW